MKKKKETECEEVLDLFAQRVRELCAERNLPLKELAARMGITYLGMSPLHKSGRTAATVKTMKAYADALDVPIWELLHKCEVSGATKRKGVSGRRAYTCPHCGQPVNLELRVRDEGDYHEEITTARKGDITDDGFLKQRVKELAKEKGLTMTELGERSGMRKNGMPVNQSNNVNLRTLSKLAKGLGVETWELTTYPECVEKETRRRRDEHPIDRIIWLRGMVLCPACKKEFTFSINPSDGDEES